MKNPAKTADLAKPLRRREPLWFGAHVLVYRMLVNVQKRGLPTDKLPRRDRFRIGNSGPFRDHWKIGKPDIFR